MSSKNVVGNKAKFISLSDLIEEICENSNVITKYDEDSLIAYYIANKNVITKEGLEKITNYYGNRKNKKNTISPKGKVIMYDGKAHVIYRVNNNTIYAKSLKDGKRIKVDISKVGSMDDLIAKISNYNFIKRNGKYEITKKSKNPISGTDLENKLKNFYSGVNKFLDNFLMYNLNTQGNPNYNTNKGQQKVSQQGNINQSGGQTNTTNPSSNIPNQPKGGSNMSNSQQNNNYGGGNVNQPTGNQTTTTNPSNSMPKRSYPTLNIPYEKELADEGLKAIWPRWYRLHEKIENDGIKFDMIVNYLFTVKMNSKKDFEEMKKYTAENGHKNLEMVIDDIDTITNKDNLKKLFENVYGKKIAEQIVNYIEKGDQWDKVIIMYVRKYTSSAKKNGIDKFLNEIKEPFIELTAYMHNVSDDAEAYIGNILNS